MKKKGNGNRVVSGVAWYRREQWTLLKSVSIDADKLEYSYDEWLEYAEKAFRDMVKEINVMKIDVDVEELIEWCQKGGIPVDSSARARFVSIKVLESQKKS